MHSGVTIRVHYPKKYFFLSHARMALVEKLPTLTMHTWSVATLLFQLGFPTWLLCAHDDIYSSDLSVCVKWGRGRGGALTLLRPTPLKHQGRHLGLPFSAAGRTSFYLQRTMPAAVCRIEGSIPLLVVRQTESLSWEVILGVSSCLDPFVLFVTGR